MLRLVRPVSVVPRACRPLSRCLLPQLLLLLKLLPPKVPSQLATQQVSAQVLWEAPAQRLGLIQQLVLRKEASQRTSGWLPLQRSLVRSPLMLELLLSWALCLQRPQDWLVEPMQATQH